MATTALSIEKNGVKTNLMISTIQSASDDLHIDIILCDDEFSPGKVISTLAKNAEEQEYHKTLREESSEKGHFVKEFSTLLDHEPEPLEDVEENN
jgi:hypothetical protein